MSGILKGSLLLAAGLLALGCGDSASKSAPKSEPAKAGGEARRGGRVVAALSSEPRTFNPVTAADAASVSVIQAMNANLVHIDRQDQAAKPALAERWTVDDNG